MHRWRLASLSTQIAIRLPEKMVAFLDRRRIRGAGGTVDGSSSFWRTLNSARRRSLTRRARVAGQLNISLLVVPCVRHRPLHHVEYAWGHSLRGSTQVAPFERPHLRLARVRRPQGRLANVAQPGLLATCAAIGPTTWEECNVATRTPRAVEPPPGVRRLPGLRIRCRAHHSPGRVRDTLSGAAATTARAGRDLLQRG